MNQNIYSLHYPPEIVFGPGAAGNLAEKLAPFHRALLVAGSHFAGTKRHDELMASLTGCDVRIVSGIHAEAPLEDVDSLVAAGREFHADAVAAVGGGSVIDCAKAAAALIPLAGDCAAYFYGARTIPGKGLFFAALPTTAGTGAEFTNNAVLTDSTARIKQSLRHPAMRPDLALVDPLLTLDCPPAQTAASGLDAFVQAFESCTSPRASNASRALSYAALDLIASHLAQAYRDGSDLAARTAMAEGSMLSAMAFSQTGLGAIHGLAHPIGSLLHVPHGRACAILIKFVVKWNLPCCEQEYARIARACAFGHTAKDFLKNTLELCRELDIPPDFSSYGLAEQHFDFIVKNCRSASMKLNPRPLTDNDVRALLREMR